MNEEKLTGFCKEAKTQMKFGEENPKSKVSVLEFLWIQKRVCEYGWVSSVSIIGLVPNSIQLKLSLCLCLWESSMRWDDYVVDKAWWYDRFVVIDFLSFTLKWEYGISEKLCLLFPSLSLCLKKGLKKQILFLYFSISLLKKNIYIFTYESSCTLSIKR